uniref:Uncharacterized protein TCIL3000_11_15360 n=1 Tax=Trypanosoma congolense (strain IL3000) TaxID=1068625 RepID=G0V2Z6_TRYCI|nr:unnamed protein product [Trypanosoma congolense IL3000]
MQSDPRGSLRSPHSFHLLAVLVPLVVAIPLFGAAATVGDPLFRVHDSSYAFLDCSACIAFAGHLGRRMNESLRYKGRGAARFLAKSLRNNNESRTGSADYATSELRTAEVLEKICNNSLFDDYSLQFRADLRIRVYGTDDTDYPAAQYYSKQDADALKDVRRKAVHLFCTRVMDEEEDAVSDIVREVVLLSELELRLCGGTIESSNATFPPASIEKAVTAVCAGVEPSLQEEVGRLERYEKWHRSMTAGAVRDDMIGADGVESVVVRGIQYTNEDPLRFTLLRRSKGESGRKSDDKSSAKRELPDDGPNPDGSRENTGSEASGMTPDL